MLCYTQKSGCNGCLVACASFKLATISVRESEAMRFWVSSLLGMAGHPNL